MNCEARVTQYSPSKSENGREIWALVARKRDTARRAAGAARREARASTETTPTQSTAATAAMIRIAGVWTGFVSWTRALN